jgi:hypothetical protein
MQDRVDERSGEGRATSDVGGGSNLLISRRDRPCHRPPVEYVEGLHKPSTEDPLSPRAKKHVAQVALQKGDTC